ncbi:MAG TPA: S-adenosylmethionine decarboxylase, partial [Pyrinomonadaceae bacterium]|nr:S-adenosylmethionine decarboxylase [Pyrinomonadaceae bacterium]
GLALLTESHLACHTYPESNLATFNLYCCRARPEWNWEENFRELFGAESVKVIKIERGHRTAIAEAKTAVGGDLR